MSTATKDPVKAPETGKTGSTTFQKFQVRYGTYWQGDEFDPTNGRQVKAPTPYGPGRKAGDIVETSQDLTKLNDRRHPNGPRFVRLGDQSNLVEAQLTADLTAERNRANKLTIALRKDLEGKTVRELIEYAETNELDLQNETKKDNILKRLFEHLDLA